MNKETMLNLILFLKDREYRIEENGEITVWIDFLDLKEFTDIFGYDELCEGGKEVILLNDSIAFDLFDTFLYSEDEEDIKYIRNKLREILED